MEVVVGMEGERDVFCALGYGDPTENTVAQPSEQKVKVSKGVIEHNEWRARQWPYGNVSG